MIFKMKRTNTFNNLCSIDDTNVKNAYYNYNIKKSYRNEIYEINKLLSKCQEDIDFIIEELKIIILQ